MREEERASGGGAAADSFPLGCRVVVDVERAPARSETEIVQTVERLGDWFHNLDLRGVRTAPHHFLGDYPAVKWRRFEHAIPHDLHSILPVGDLRIVTPDQARALRNQ